MYGDDVSDDGGEYDDGGDDENWEKQGTAAATSHGIKITPEGSSRRVHGRTRLYTRR